MCNMPSVIISALLDEEKRVLGWAHTAVVKQLCSEVHLGATIGNLPIQNNVFLSKYRKFARYLVWILTFIARENALEIIDTRINLK